MKSIACITCLLLVSLSFAIAQNCNAKRYDELVKEGQNALTTNNFLESIQYFNSAKDYCPQKSKEVDKMVLAVVQKIQELKNKTDSALIETERQKQIADENLQKANKLINAFYFAYNRFALAFKDGRFYFIDKNGDKVEKLGEWDRAEQFNESLFTQQDIENGLFPLPDRTVFTFTRIWNSNEEYWLDTLGNAYKIAYSIRNITDNVEAFCINRKKLAIDRLFSNLPTKIQLKCLFIRGAEIKKLSQKIGRLKNLKTLFINIDELTTLPSQIGELENLVNLNLRYNLLTTLPSQIGELENLTTLDISYNKLISLPDQIGDLKNLQELYLGSDFNPLQLQGFTWGSKSQYQNQLIELPIQIGELKNLTTLHLNNNKLTTLPIQIGELKNLTTLHLGGNQLQILPAQIGELKNLTTLHLNNNKLTALPIQIGELKSLTSLDLGGNQLTALPTQIGELKSLTTLHLGGNQLQILPTQIWELKNLTTLQLGGNQLSSLPTQIWELKNLTSLGLWGNKLESLPAQIGELKNLKWLSLNANPLSVAEINKSLALLPKLEILYLGDLGLSSLPEAVLGLKELKTLYLTNYDKDKKNPNNFSEAEQEKIRKLLPNCEVEF